jgi:hypothetical protein
MRQRVRSERPCGGFSRPAIELRNHHFRVPTLSYQGEGHAKGVVMGETLADTAESENLSMRRHSNRENRETQAIPLPRKRPGTVREGLRPHVGYARRLGVGRFRSTGEADEQTRGGGGGVRGGKETDQGDRQANLTRAGLRAGLAWHRIAECTTSRLAADRHTQGKSRMR